jgi:hypothetical protein
MSFKNRFGKAVMQLEKLRTFNNDIIFIDGLWGTGKSVVSPIISGMAGVEKAKIEGIYEYISWLYYFEKIDFDGAQWMLQTYADCSQYNNVIGREVNLRWSDDTGLGNTPDRLAYLFRLFKDDGDLVVDQINDKNLALCVMSHMLMLTPELLKRSYRDRVKVVEVVRHPLYMIEHFASYLDRFDSPREFTMSYYVEGIKVPWFAQEFENRFINSNSIERAILCIIKLYPWLEVKLRAAEASGLSLLELSFEQIVFQTDDTLRKLSQYLGRDHHPRVASILKRQLLPRDEVLSGKGHRKYGWRQTKATESKTYERLMRLVLDHCQAELGNDFFRLIDWYNSKYPSILGDYASH